VSDLGRWVLSLGEEALCGERLRPINRVVHEGDFLIEGTVIEDTTKGELL
jgi:hypothetical protein